MPSESGVLDLRITEPLQHCAGHPQVSGAAQVQALCDPHALSVHDALTLIALPSPQSSQRCIGEAGAA